MRVTTGGGYQGCHTAHTASMRVTTTAAATGRPHPLASRRPPGRRRLAPIAAAWTQPARQAINAAHAEAVRQGGMFLAPPHLLQGLLATPESAACDLLATKLGLTAAAAEAAFVDQEALPQHSSVRPAELHWAPDARAALDAAAAAARAAGAHGRGFNAQDASCVLTMSQRLLLLALLQGSQRQAHPTCCWGCCAAAAIRPSSGFYSDSVATWRALPVRCVGVLGVCGRGGSPRSCGCCALAS
jgi:hypothetical protein